eukprot:2050584-Amphidinium_carterae.1
MDGQCCNNSFERLAHSRVRRRQLNTMPGGIQISKVNARQSSATTKSLRRVLKQWIFVARSTYPSHEPTCPRSLASAGCSPVVFVWQVSGYSQLYQLNLRRLHS